MFARLSSTKSKVFSANLLLFLILSVFLFVNNLQFKKYNEDRLTERLRDNVSYIQSWFDANLQSVFDLTYRLRGEHDVVLAAVSLRQDRAYFDRLTQIMSRLRVLRTDVSVVEDAYLYFGNFDRVVSHDGTRDYDVYTATRAGRQVFSKSDLAVVPHSGTVLSRTGAMMIVAPINAHNAVVAELNREEVERRLSALNTVPGAQLVIHVDNHAIFWSGGRGPAGLLIETAAGSMELTPGPAVDRIERTSNESELLYSAFYDPALLQRQLRIVNVYTAAFFAAIILFNIAAIVFYKRTFAPLDDLIERIGGPGPPTNELHFINQEFSRIETSNYELRAELKTHRKTQIEVLLSRSVQYGSQVRLADVFSYTTDGSAAAVLAVVGASSDLTGSAEALQIEEQLADRMHVARLPIRSGIHAYLIATQDEDPVAAVQAAVAEAQGLLGDRWYVGLSSLVDTEQSTGLRTLYNESVSALESSPARPIGRVVVYSPEMQPWNSGLTLSDESMIIDGFTAGEVEAVSAKISSILEPGNHSVGELRRLIFQLHDLLEVILRSRGEEGLIAESPRLDGYNVRSNAETVISRFADAAGALAGRDRSLLSIIYDYVEHHYMEGIGTTEVARGLGMTAGYISSYFHSHTGERLVHYINSVCVAKGSELLRSKPDAAVSEVARAVGMPNPNTFIRNFKRFKGCTPGEYRHTAAPLQ